MRDETVVLLRYVTKMSSSSLKVDQTYAPDPLQLPHGEVGCAAVLAAPVKRRDISAASTQYRRDATQSHKYWARPLSRRGCVDVADVSATSPFCDIGGA